MKQESAQSIPFYKAVVNQEEQYSIWPAQKPNPLGWKDTGKTGTHAEVLQHVGQVWTDMRPASLGRHADALAQASFPVCTGKCIPELFEIQAANNATATALVFGEQYLTFGELNSRANQLASYLRRRHAGPEVFVGICLPPSLEASITALAILKSGSAYVSLAPSEPRQRLAETVRDAEPALVVSRTEFRNIIKGIDPICLDEAADQIAAESPEDVATGVMPDNAAVLRYTSGSTGKPKGIVSSHRSLTSRLVSGPLPDVQKQDVCMLKMSPRVFERIALGVKVILSDKDVYDVQQLTYTVKKHAVTSLYIVPSVLRQLLTLDSDAIDRLKGLRVVTVGGEPLTPDVVQRFREVLPGVSFINAYASTESGSFAAMRVVSEAWDADWRSVGHPIHQTQIHILDESMNPVPAGTRGEIYVASSHLARGYLRRPDLTAQQFLPDPFGSCPGGRLYRTGDLGCYLERGEIQFLGRVDRQVKVRGFRVELGEIEGVLQEDAQVHESAVTTRETDKDMRLVAYVVAKSGTEPTVRELRSHLQRYLPDYMIPATFVFIDRLPRTGTGKVDYHALPAPDSTRPELDNDYVEPCTSIEATLAEIWANVLNLDKVGRHDNFLELGGDSLGMAQLMVRIDDEFGVEMPLQAVLERLTVAELASYIAADLENISSRQGTLR